jgi:uncharacterized protein
MTSQNVDVVRRASDAFRKRDTQAMLRDVDPDVEFSDPERVGAGPYRGHEAYLRWLEEWLESWETYDAEVEALVEAADNVVAFVHHWGRARGSGVEIDHRGAHLYRLTDGRITGYRPYTRREEALDAAGLDDGAAWRATTEMLVGIYRAWNERDVDWMMRRANPDAVLVPVPQSPDLSAVRGKEGLEQFMATLLDVWERFRLEPIAFTPVGRRMLVDVSVNGLAKDSGIELAEQWAHAWTFRDGKVERMQGFATHDEALDALAYPETR